MNVREATVDDAKEISELLVEAVKAQKEQDFDEAGWKHFLKSSSPLSTIKRLTGETYFTLCYVENGSIVGIITMCDYVKLDQLFVLPQARNKGISKALWTEAKKRCLDNGSTGDFWVRASPMAVPVYEKFGFSLKGGLRIEKGIKHYLMQVNPLSPINA